MTHEALRTQIKAILRRDTKAFAKKLAEPAAASKLSPKAQAIMECLRTKDFGTYKEALRSILSIALGEELPSLKEASTMFVNCGFLAVVATTNKFSAHEYHTDGQVAARLPGFNFDYTDQFVKQSGRIGAHMTSDIREFRPATDEEISNYVDKLGEETMTYLSKHVVVLEPTADEAKEAAEKEKADKAAKRAVKKAEKEAAEKEKAEKEKAAPPPAPAPVVTAA